MVRLLITAAVSRHTGDTMDEWIGGPGGVICRSLKQEDTMHNLQCSTNINKALTWRRVLCYSIDTAYSVIHSLLV